MVTGRVYLYIILANDTLQNLPNLTYVYIIFRAPSENRPYFGKCYPVEFIFFFLVIGTLQRVARLATRFTRFIECAYDF